MLQLKYFASLRDQLNAHDEAIAWDSYHTVAELKAELHKRGESWRQLLSGNNVLVAVNQEMAFDSTAIKDGDEIAFFPPVTGG